MKKAIYLALFVTLIGCAAPRIPHIQRSHDPGIDFSKLHTFAWAENHLAVRIDQRYMDALRSALQATLAEKGFEINHSQPDFLVAATINLESKNITINDTSHLKPYLRSADGKPVTFTIEEGGIMINLLEPNSEKLIFQGIAKTEVNQTLTPEQREERIAQTVQEILKDFPPTR